MPARGICASAGLCAKRPLSNEVEWQNKIDDDDDDWDDDDYDVEVMYVKD